MCVMTCVSVRHSEGLKNFHLLSCNICEAGSCRSGVVQCLGTWPYTKDCLTGIHLEKAAYRLHCQHRWNTAQIAQRQRMIKYHKQVNVVWWGKIGKGNSGQKKENRFVFLPLSAGVSSFELA